MPMSPVVDRSIHDYCRGLPRPMKTLEVGKFADQPMVPIAEAAEPDSMGTVIYKQVVTGGDYRAKVYGERPIAVIISFDEYLRLVTNAQEGGS